MSTTGSQVFASGCSTKPVPYQAEYSVIRKNKPAGSMHVVLESTGTDTFRYRMDTRVKRGLLRPRIMQQSEFTWKDGSVLPDRFDSTQRVSLYKRSETVKFDRATWRATGRKKRSDFEVTISGQVQDKLTIYLLLARKICEGEHTIDADVVSGPVLKPYRYDFQAKELMKTGLGTLETVHIRRGTPEDEKQTDLWSAEEAGFLPVKLVYRNKKDVTTMMLDQILFSKQTD